MLCKLMLLKCIIDVINAKPPAAGDFCVFFENIIRSNANWITIRTFSQSFEKNKLLKFESHLK